MTKMIAKFKKRIVPFLLFLVISIGFFFRFWRLAKYPTSLSIDEVAVAYNSYSILKTGRDEWGNFLPLAFRSIGDWKPPVLGYLMIPAIAVFGLNEFGTRFTEAFFGVLTLPFVYLLIKQIAKNEKVALLTTFSLAVSPWHLQVSRMTHEAVLALFWVIVGTWLFLISLEREKKWYWLAAIFFSLSLYTYHAERVFTPIFVFGLVVIFRKELMRDRRDVVPAVILGILLSLPFVKIMLGPEGQTRATHIFIDRDFLLNFQLHKKGENLTFLEKVFDNNLLLIFNFWVKRYLNYFDFSFLFFKGIKLTLPEAPDSGVMYLFELPLLLMGIWQIFIKRKFLTKKYYLLVIFWLLAGPLAASFSNNEQHAARSLTTLPIPQFLVGVGMLFLIEEAVRLGKRKSFLIFLGSAIIIFISFIYYIDLYYLHFPVHYSEFWDYGLKEAAQFAWEHQKDYKEIVFDPAFGTKGPYIIGTPYLYVLFYGKYEPSLFQKDPRRQERSDSVDFANFTFRSIYWPKDRFKRDTLFIGSPWALSREELGSAKILKEISFQNGVVGFLIVETK